MYQYRQLSFRTNQYFFHFWEKYPLASLFLHSQPSQSPRPSALQETRLRLREARLRPVPRAKGENEPLRRQKLENSLRVCSPLFFFRLFEDDCWYVCVHQKEDKCQAVCETKQNLRHNNTLHSVTQHNTINAMPARILLLVHLLQRPP